MEQIEVDEFIGFGILFVMIIIILVGLVLFR